MKTASVLKVKKSGIRAIDQGTRRDIVANLRRLTRRIENGEFPNIHHIAVGISSAGLDGCRHTEMWGCGEHNVADVAYTILQMQNIAVNGA